MKCFAEMYLTFAMTLVTVTTLGLIPSCPEFCESLSTHLISTSLQPLKNFRHDCDCSDQRHTQLVKHSLIYDGTGKYYDPAIVMNFQNPPIINHPFYVINPVAITNLKNMMHRNNKLYNKYNHDTRGTGTLSNTKDLVDTENTITQKYKRKVDTQNESSNESKKLPLYMDIDILESAHVGSGIIKSQIEDFSLIEKDLSDCIALHLLINSRKSGNITEIKTNWNAEIRQYENLSDSDLIIVVEKKCVNTASIVKNSLHEIKGTLVIKKNDAYRSAHSVVKDRTLNNTSTSDDSNTLNITMPLDLQSEGIVASTNLIRISTNATTPYVYTKSHPLINSRVLNEYDVNEVNEQKQNNYQRASLENSTKISAPSTQTTIKDTIVEYIKVSNFNKNHRNNDSITPENSIYTDYVQSTDLTPMSFFNKQLFNISKDNDSDNSSSTIGNRNRLVKERRTQNYDYISVTKIKFENTGAATIEDSTENILTESNTDNTITTSFNAKYNSVKSHDTQTEPIETKTAKLVADGNSYMANYYGTDEKNNTKNYARSYGVNHPTSAVTVKDKTNRSEYLEKDIQLNKIITREYPNDTVTSTIDGNEQLANLDFIDDSEKTTQMIDYAMTKPIIRSSHNYFSSISGTLYFFYGQQYIPARFIQKADGKINLGIDGFALCDALNQKGETKSVLLADLCKCTLSQNCTNKYLD